MLRTVASGEETKGPSTPRLRRSAQDDTSQSRLGLQRSV